MKIGSNLLQEKDPFYEGQESYNWITCLEPNKMIQKKTVKMTIQMKMQIKQLLFCKRKKGKSWKNKFILKKPQSHCNQSLSTMEDHLSKSQCLRVK